MSSAYENVGRLVKTSAKMIQQPSVTTTTTTTSGKLNDMRSKQRKWRVILSIGLLLPALAAIIGEYSKLTAMINLGSPRVNIK